MYWYCGYCWYIGTSHSICLYQYVTGTALVLLFICTGTVGTVGTLVPATLFVCANMLLVLHWYCCLYVLVLWVLLVRWYQPLYVSVPICYWYCTGTAVYIYWYCGYCWYTGTSHSMSLCQYATGTALVLRFICTSTVGTVDTLVPATLFVCTNMLLVLHWYCCLCPGSVGTVGTLVPATLFVCTNMLLVLHWYCTGTAVYMSWYCGYCWYTGTSHSICLYQYVTGTALVLQFICIGTVGTVGTLVPATLFVCTNMLLVLHWYCSLYVLVLWVLLVHWYQPLYFCVPICYWYCTGTALYMYWYCGYCWYIGTSHSMSLYQYVTGTALVLLFICTGTVGTVGTLVPATLSLYQYVTGTALVLLFICTGSVGTVGTLVPATQCLCAYMLLVLHWYCCSYVLVLWVLLVHWYQPLYVSVPICYWYCTGSAVYMYWYCGNVGTLVRATLCLCTNMLLVLLFICTGTVVMLVHWYQPLYVSVPICYWYCTGTAVYMYWYFGYGWYTGTSHSMSLYQYVTGTVYVTVGTLVPATTGTVGTVGTLIPATLFVCTNMLLVLHWYCSLYVLVLWVLLVHWYQPLYFCVPICYWYCTGTALYMYWYCGYCWYTGTCHSMSLHEYVTGTALVLLFRCIGTVGTVGTLVPAILCLCTNMLLVLHRYCTGTALYMYWYCGYCWYTGSCHSMSLDEYAVVLHWYCYLYVLVLRI